MKSKKEARSFAYELVSDGKNDITKLDREELEILTSHLIDSYEINRAFEFISEPNESNDFPYMLAKYMRNGQIDDGIDLLNLMIKGAVKSAKNEIVDLLIEQDQEYRFNMKYERE